MSNKIFTVFFTERGSPKAGLTPTITIAEIDGTVVVNADNMAAIPNMTGWYSYTFTDYDANKKYVLTADGGASLPVNERYQIAHNEQNTDLMVQIEANRLKIDDTANTLTIFEDDGVTELFVFDLKDQNGVANARNVFERIPQ